MRDYTSRPMGVENYRPQSADFGSKLPYAKYHQHGTRNMPARRVLFPTRQLDASVADRIKRYLLTGE